MTKLLAVSALLAFATPTLAAGSNLAGRAVFDQQQHKIGTIEYTANINGRENAVMTIPTAMYGNTTVALPLSELRPAGNGMTVSISVDQLVHMPCAIAPCSKQAGASG